MIKATAALTKAKLSAVFRSLFFPMVVSDLANVYSNICIVTFEEFEMSNFVESAPD